MALRGPTRSSQVPNSAADTPRNTMATLKTHPMVLSDQSPAVDAVIPMERDSGMLKTLNAYACPIERWTARAAGGTRHLL